MNVLLSREFAETALCLVGMWFVIVAVFFYLGVQFGGRPRFVIRVLYVIFWIAFSAYLVFRSAYGPFFLSAGQIGPALPALGLWDLVQIIVLFATYHRKPRSA